MSDLTVGRLEARRGEGTERRHVRMASLIAAPSPSVLRHNLHFTCSSFGEKVDRRTSLRALDAPASVFISYTYNYQKDSFALLSMDFL